MKKMIKRLGAVFIAGCALSIINDLLIRYGIKWAMKK